MGPIATPPPPRALAAKLGRISLLRGVLALALGAYVFSQSIGPPASLARVVAVYGILDGLVALWASLALVTISLQIVMTTANDLLLGLEVRRRIPGEWSLLLGAALSIVLSLLVAAPFFGPALLPWRLLGAVGLLGGLSLVVGAFRLRLAS